MKQVMMQKLPCLKRFDLYDVMNGIDSDKRQFQWDQLVESAGLG